MTYITPSSAAHLPWRWMWFWFKCRCTELLVFLLTVSVFSTTLFVCSLTAAQSHSKWIIYHSKCFVSAQVICCTSISSCSWPQLVPAALILWVCTGFVTLILSFFFFFVYGECVVFICPVIWITKNEFLTRVLFSFPPPPFFEMQPQTMTQRSLCFRFQSVVHAVTLLVISDTEAPKYLWL